MRFKKRDFFTSPGENKIKNPKDYFFRRINHQGFNLELMLIEQVVVVYNAVNELAGSDQK